MNAYEFRAEYERLSRGFNRERDVTDERLKALYAVLGHYAIADVRAGIDSCLRRDRFPSFDGLHAAIDHATDESGKRRTVADRTKDGRVMSGPLVRIPDRAELEAARLYRDICVRAWDANHSPFETAALVETLAKTYPSLAEEVRHLRAMGDHWRNAAGETLGDGGRGLAANYREVMDAEVEPEQFEL